MLDLNALHRIGGDVLLYWRYLVVLDVEIGRCMMDDARYWKTKVLERSCRFLSVNVKFRPNWE